MTQERVLELLSTIPDPELGINIVDLGLVYWVNVDGKTVDVDYTLTYPGCPIGPMLQEQIERVLKDDTDVEEVRTRLVWEPLWTDERMSEAARLEMGYPI
jgi:metal-sulfur cluster biosynthetic enzyme